jgi:hypothetical protein
MYQITSFQKGSVSTVLITPFASRLRSRLLAFSTVTHDQWISPTSTSTLVLGFTDAFDYRQPLYRLHHHFLNKP